MLRSFTRNIHYHRVPRQLKNPSFIALDSTLNLHSVDVVIFEENEIFNCTIPPSTQLYKLVPIAEEELEELKQKHLDAETFEHFS